MKLQIKKKKTKAVKNSDRAAIFTPPLADARAHVGTFLLFLVLFAGTGATRGQAGLSALAVQTRLRRPKQAADAPGAGGRKEGRRERWTEQLSSRSRRGLERKRLALRHTNTYAAVLNSAHSWMLCHGVRGEAHQAAAVAAAASFYDRSV